MSKLTKPSADQLKAIETHGFTLTSTDTAYVLRDPTKPKNGKFEGTNLSTLITQAHNSHLAGKRVDAENVTPIRRTMTPEKAAALNRQNQKLANEATSTEYQPDKVSKPADKKATTTKSSKPATTPAATGKPVSTAPAAASTAKGKQEKKDPLEWTTGKVGMLIFENPSKTDSQIAAMVKAAGIKSGLNTVKTLRRYFDLCLRLQVAFAGKHGTVPVAVVAGEN